MKIRVRLFAHLVEIAGYSVKDIELPNGLTIGRARPYLIESLQLPKDVLHQTMLAVNQMYAEPGMILCDGDELAFLPPVGGGSRDDTHRLRITSEVLSIEQAYQQMEDAQYGATVVFVGTVREWTNEQQTSHLQYEAYPEMAIRQLRTLNREIMNEYPNVQTLIWHRIGELRPTDIAVICAASSPHRVAAFDVARALIERLKKEVPIWKKEYFTNGQSTWQPNP